MDIDARLSISYYRTVATINEAHKVYLVQHSQTGKFYVKKILSVYSAEIYRFLKANPIPGIPCIVEFYEENNVLTLIEEYVSGSSLREIMESGNLTTDMLCRIMIKLCSILEKLHSHVPPMVHRDLKPSNIMVTSTEAVMLLDFNASKFSSCNGNRESDTVLIGTQGYAAPEQYGFGESTPKSDIYSLGVIIKEAVSYCRADNTIIINPIIEKCKQMDPDQRYASVTELKNDLMALLSGSKPESSNKAERSDYNKDKVSGIISYLPPGFRTKNPIKIMVALPGYILLCWFFLTADFEFPMGLTWLIRIVMLTMAICSIFIAFDYRGIQQKFALCRNKTGAEKFFCILIILVGFNLIMFFILLATAIVLFGDQISL